MPAACASAVKDVSSEMTGSATACEPSAFFRKMTWFFSSLAISAARSWTTVFLKGTLLPPRTPPPCVPMPPVRLDGRPTP